jgi:hypothetical protein
MDLTVIASYYIKSRWKIKIAKWGTPNKIKKKEMARL